MKNIIAVMANILNEGEVIKDYDVSKIIDDRVCGGSFSTKSLNINWELSDNPCSTWKLSDLKEGFFKVWTNERTITLFSDGKILYGKLPEFYMYMKVYGMKKAA